MNSTFTQPIFGHSTVGGEQLCPRGENWGVPITLNVAELTKIGRPRVQVGIGGRSYIDKPERRPELGLRAVLAFLFSGE